MRSLALLVCAASLLAGCRSHVERGAPGATVDTVALSDELFAVLPLDEDLDPRKVALGRRLFDDVRLSGDETVACVSCHLREHAYSNNAAHAALPTRPAGEVNVPTLYNVGYNYRYNWSGQFETLEAQLDALIENPKVMRSSWAIVVPRLAADPTYARDFAEAYPDVRGGISRSTVPGALIAYMRSLTTPGSKFDAWLSGDKSAFSAEAREGFLLFQSYGCLSCHQGRNVGGNFLQQFGIMEDYFAGRPTTDADRGLAQVTKDPRDEHVFRVPSLRNVELTAPYFHDGTAATLEDAVRVMGRVQLGRDLDALEVSRLAAFLRTLTGEVARKALR